MASSVITVSGVRAMGRHGANPGEQAREQEFVVDVTVWVEVDGDSLAATLDYRSIVETVRATIEKTSFMLLESLAQAVARALVEQSPAARATAVVHKPAAARSLAVTDVAAEASAAAE